MLYVHDNVYPGSVAIQCWAHPPRLRSRSCELTIPSPQPCIFQAPGLLIGIRLLGPLTCRRVESCRYNSIAAGLPSCNTIVARAHKARDISTTLAMFLLTAGHPYLQCTVHTMCPTVVRLAWKRIAVTSIPRSFRSTIELFPLHRTASAAAAAVTMATMFTGRAQTARSPVSAPADATVHQRS